MLAAVSKAALDAKFLRLQNIHLRKDESIVDYTSRILEVVRQLEEVGRPFQDRTKASFAHRSANWLWCDGETIMSVTMEYHEVVEKLIVWETRLKTPEDQPSAAILTHVRGPGKKCYTCEKLGHVTRNSWKNRSGARNKGNTNFSGQEEIRICYKCGQPGNVASNFKLNKNAGVVQETAGTAMITVWRVVTEKGNQLRWRSGSSTRGTK